MEENNIITCPNCGKKHSVIRKDGGLRETIYCKCKDDHHHTKICWITGFGYHIFDDNGDLISVF